MDASRRRSLTRQAELGDGEAVALMAAMVERAGHVRQTSG
jgi:hypothetical protein